LRQVFIKEIVNYHPSYLMTAIHRGEKSLEHKSVSTQASFLSNSSPRPSSSASKQSRPLLAGRSVVSSQRSGATAAGDVGSVYTLFADSGADSPKMLRNNNNTKYRPNKKNVRLADGMEQTKSNLRRPDSLQNQQSCTFLTSDNVDATETEYHYLVESYGKDQFEDESHDNSSRRDNKVQFENGITNSVQDNSYANDEVEESQEASAVQDDSYANDSYEYADETFE